MLNPAPPKIISADVLIIGSGIAGLLLALELSESGASIVLASKQSLYDSNTSMAQGGLAAVSGSNMRDALLLHLQDTIKAGAGLTDESVAQRIVDGGPLLIERLQKYGVTFDTVSGGNLSLVREGGHSQARVLHHQDVTGRTITSALVSVLMEKAQGSKNITIYEHAMADKLLVHDNHCVGAQFCINEKHVLISADRIVLSTGGIGRIFSRTTNPSVATGDGIALAYRAGARLADMEMVQFHPTALHKKDAPAFLISEAVRGAGAILIDSRGDKFAKRFHPDAELATRDVIARGIDTIMQEQNAACVFLDLRPIGKKLLDSHFPHILHTCQQFGIDPYEEAVPVSPAAHYFMGGVWTDNNGSTTINGLYALGECAATGLHGANRLASNSLLEAGVGAIYLSDYIKRLSNTTTLHSKRTISEISSQAVPLPADLNLMRDSMYRFCGLVRCEEGLANLLSTLSDQSKQRLCPTTILKEASNAFLVSTLIANAALKRRESRGAHYRSDYPSIDNINFKKRLSVSQNEGWNWLPIQQFDKQIDKRKVRTA
jgi:L-aspartate oxidase